MKAHATAVVDPAAVVAEDVEVGPYCVVGAGARVGPGCRLLARVILTGPVTVGRENVFHPNAVIGGAPQAAEATAPGGRIEIGDGNVFREAVTVNLPTTPDGITEIGSRNRFHAHSNVGHDCIVGSDIVIGSFAGLAGHTRVDDQACIEGSGGTGARVRVGRGGRLESHCMAASHVPPFMVAGGDRPTIRGVNPRFRTPALERAFETIWTSGLALDDALRKLESDPSPDVIELVDFLRRPPLETSL